MTRAPAATGEAGCVRVGGRQYDGFGISAAV
jgi:hypothetical protein